MTILYVAAYIITKSDAVKLFIGELVSVFVFAGSYVLSALILGILGIGKNWNQCSPTDFVQVGCVPSGGHSFTIY